MALEWDFGRGDFRRSAPPARDDLALRRHMISVYNLLAAGLLVSALVAWAASLTPLINILPRFETGRVTGTTAGWIIMFAPMVLSVAFPLLVRAAPWLSSLFFWAIIVLSGLSQAAFVSLLADTSIITAILITGTAFSALSIFGYFSRFDLDSLTVFFVMLATAIIFGGVLYLLKPQGAVSLAIWATIALLFFGSTARDTQKIKELFDPDADESEKRGLAVIGALDLYRDLFWLFGIARHILNTKDNDNPF